MSNLYTVRRGLEITGFTIPSVTVSGSSSSNSDVVFPQGAIVTGLRLLSPSAVTNTGNTASVSARVGAYVLGNQAGSDLPAQTVPQIFTLGTTDGKYIGASGSFNVIVSATGTGAATCPGVTGDYNFYVDYIVPVS